MKVRITKLSEAQDPDFRSAKTEAEYRETTNEVSTPEGHEVIGELMADPKLGEPICIIHDKYETTKMFRTSPVKKMIARTDMDSLSRYLIAETHNSKYKIEQYDH